MLSVPLPVIDKFEPAFVCLVIVNVSYPKTDVIDLESLTPNRALDASSAYASSVPVTFRAKP